MLKQIFVVIGILLGVFSLILTMFWASEALGQEFTKKERCELDSELAREAAQLRDDGIDIGFVVQMFMWAGLTEEQAIGNALFVYRTHQGKTPKQLKYLVYGLCMGDPV